MKPIQNGRKAGGGIPQITWIMGVIPAALFLFSAIVPFLFLYHQSLNSPDIAFIRQRTQMPWIMYPTPVVIAIKSVDRVPVSTFTKEFDVTGNVSSDARLLFRAWGDTKIDINGRFLDIPESTVGNWKKGLIIPVASYLREGRNKIRAEVRNPMGPGLLAVCLKGLSSGDLVSDESWLAEFSGLSPARAMIADDTRMHPKYLSETLPSEIFRRNGTRLAVYFALFVIAFFMGRFMMDSEKSLRWLPVLGLAGVQIAWLALFFKRFLHFPLEVGFDFTGHLEYVRYYLAHHKLPDPAMGWETHQPPFFYMASVWARGLLSLFLGPGNEDNAFKVIPFLSGLGQSWLAFFLAHRVFEREPVKVFLATVMAGMIPMNLYMSAYVSNEAFQAFLSSAAILAAVYFLTGKEKRLTWILVFGVSAGFALLTKFTSFTILGVSFMFFAVVLLFVDKVPVAKASGYLFAAAGLVLALSGWFYGHNFKTYGQWMVVDWHHWWQDPGFHTSRYFSIFGESLKHPYFAPGFRSFWDGLYSTFWGDGLGDKYGYSHPALWSYDYMSIGYLLALPATVLLGAGFLRAAMAVFDKKEKHGFKVNMSFLLSIIVCGIYSIAYFCIKAPFWSSPKAGYALYLTVPLAILFALGLETAGKTAPIRFRLVWQAILSGWFGALKVILYLSYAG